MNAVSMDTVRLFMHVLAGSDWVRGQIVLASLVPALRGAGTNVPRAETGLTPWRRSATPGHPWPLGWKALSHVDRTGLELGGPLVTCQRKSPPATPVLDLSSAIGVAVGRLGGRVGQVLLWLSRMGVTAASRVALVDSVSPRCGHRRRKDSPAGSVLCRPSDLYPT